MIPTPTTWWKTSIARSRAGRRVACICPSPWDAKAIANAWTRRAPGIVAKIEPVSLRGLSARGRRGALVLDAGQPVVTPQLAQDYLEAARTQIMNLNADIKAADPSVLGKGNVQDGVAFKASWAEFVIKFTGFYEENKDVWWHAAAVMDQTDQYLKEAKAWEAAFKERGGSPTIPIVVPTPPPGLGSVLTPIAVIAAVALAWWLLRR